MINQTLFWTAFFAALFLTAALKFLHMFYFIEWSPVRWLERMDVTKEGLHPFLPWLFMFLTLFVLFVVLYVLLSWTHRIPGPVTSIIIAAVIAVAIEWSIHSPETVKKGLSVLSIPFFVVLSISLHFVTGTAVFMKKLAMSCKK